LLACIPEARKLGSERFRVHFVVEVRRDAPGKIGGFYVAAGRDATSRTESSELIGCVREKLGAISWPPEVHGTVCESTDGCVDIAVVDVELGIVTQRLVEDGDAPCRKSDASGSGG
jgi:hypothetical protein